MQVHHYCCAALKDHTPETLTFVKQATPIIRPMAKKDAPQGSITDTIMDGSVSTNKLQMIPQNRPNIGKPQPANVAEMRTNIIIYHSFLLNCSRRLMTVSLGQVLLQVSSVSVSSSPSREYCVSRRASLTLVGLFLNEPADVFLNLVVLLNLRVLAVLALPAMK